MESLLVDLLGVNEVIKFSVEHKNVEYDLLFANITRKVHDMDAAFGVGKKEDNEEHLTHFHMTFSEFVIFQIVDDLLQKGFDIHEPKEPLAFIERNIGNKLHLADIAILLYRAKDDIAKLILLIFLTNKPHYIIISHTDDYKNQTVDFSGMDEVGYRMHSNLSYVINLGNYLTAFDTAQGKYVGITEYAQFAQKEIEDADAQSAEYDKNDIASLKEYLRGQLHIHEINKGMVKLDGDLSIENIVNDLGKSVSGSIKYYMKRGNIKEVHLDLKDFEHTLHELDTMYPSGNIGRQKHKGVTKYHTVKQKKIID